ncbi:hypothetical protein P8C59_007975 [Phyllachora maydis]|uniref:Glycogen synthase kinase 1 n=2 Tax=Phyllachora maydis TaxID=1825666 RepID=A0AAD9IAJ6_9PEZI|nr:hypothetical protein P8C59_007975 [Phyllachora maydis]
MTLILLDRHLICSLNFSLDNTPEPFDFALAPSSPSQNRAFANLVQVTAVSTLKVPSVPREERQRQFAAPSPPDSALSCALSSDLTNPARYCYLYHDLRCLRPTPPIKSQYNYSASQAFSSYPRVQERLVQYHSHVPKPTRINPRDSRLHPTEWCFNNLRMGEIVREKVQDGVTGETRELQYTQCKIVGNGSFGVVFQTKLSPSNEDAAIKRVLQDKRFKNRELQIMRIVRHPNIVQLKAFYYSNGDRKDEVYLNLVQEFVPETVYRASRFFNKLKTTMPVLEVKLYIYQLFRALAYIHSQGICHRDIKPQNLLLDPSTGVLKLCDFGSAKILVENEPNVSYICSRYYRAPELIFGATNYTTKIDVWSTGCVMAELMLGQPLFPGESGIDQLVEIIKVLGTPTREQIRTMNPNYMEHKFPQIKPHPFNKVFRKADANAIDLIARLLEYTPTERLSAINAMVHPFFSELRDPSTKFPDSRHQTGQLRDLPPLFDFSRHELSIAPNLNEQLVPPHMRPVLAAQGLDIDHFAPMSKDEMMAKLD